MCLASKSYLRLALESLYVVGNSVNEESGAALRQLHFNADEGFSGIVAGKEFTLMTSSSGKVNIVLLNQFFFLIFIYYNIILLHFFTNRYFVFFILNFYST